MNGQEKTVKTPAEFFARYGNERNVTMTISELIDGPFSTRIKKSSISIPAAD